MEILENPAIKPIANKYCKSIAQVVLRWLYQQNISIIPKTWNPAHLRENIEIFDFQLTDEEMKSIDSLDRGKFLNYDPYPAMKNVPKKYRDWKSF